MAIRIADRRAAQFHHLAAVSSRLARHPWIELACSKLDVRFFPIFLL